MRTKDSRKLGILMLGLDLVELGFENGVIISKERTTEGTVMGY